jgi:hypothetical protein
MEDFRSSLLCTTKHASSWPAQTPRRRTTPGRSARRPVAWCPVSWCSVTGHHEPPRRVTGRRSSERPSGMVISDRSISGWWRAPSRPGHREFLTHTPGSPSRASCVLTKAGAARHLVLCVHRAACTCASVAVDVALDRVIRCVPLCVCVCVCVCVLSPGVRMSVSVVVVPSACASV